MKKILWVSKNTPLDSQVTELKRLFGEDAVIDQDGKPFSSAQDILRRYRRGGYDEMVLIAPLSVCRIVVSLGCKPLWSEMSQVTASQSELEVQGMGDRIRGTSRYYRFVKFKRLESIDIKYSNLNS
jgi:hypothetical protein